MKLRYLTILLIILSVTSLFIGVKGISPLDIFHLTDEQAQILYVSRFPRFNKYHYCWRWHEYLWINYAAINEE